MTAATRWVIIVVAALAILGLLIWARGYAHHEGDEVGSVAAVVR